MIYVQMTKFSCIHFEIREIINVESPFRQIAPDSAASPPHPQFHPFALIVKHLETIILSGALRLDNSEHFSDYLIINGNIDSFQ